MKKYSLFFMLLFMLTGCGFKLRDSFSFSSPIRHLYIETNTPYSLLTANLKQFFKRTSVHVTSSAKEADIILNILNEKETQPLISISSTQQTREYNLTVSITFQLKDRSGKIIVPQETMSESRTFTIQSSQILSGSNEAYGLYQQLWQALVYTVANRLASKEIAAQINKMVTS